MCGIVGIISKSNNLDGQKMLHRMTDVQRHRGPDAHGYFVEAPAFLGHRRLSIIDTSERSNQPMSTTEGRYTLVYNGEIYNFRELRAELDGHGYVFQTSGDAEVVLKSFAHWQEQCFARFNGMFAIAVWDREEQRLILARDRYGIKPCYYADLSTAFVFASEIKSIRLFEGFSNRVDEEALLEYFTFQNIFTDRTLFSGVKLLKAGSYLVYSARNQKSHIHQYWDYCFREDSSLNDEQEIVETVRHLFEQAVQRQLVSDVEVGGYLSSGIDSGSIVSVASRQMQGFKSFTCGFDMDSISGLELSFDERAQAEAMAAFLKTEHYECILKSGDMERVLPELVWHLEDLRVGQCYPNYYAAKLASHFVKVVLSGDGGDELFAGYPWRYFRTFESRNFSEYVDQYYLYWQRLIPNKTIHQIFSPVWNSVKHVWTRDIFESVFPKNHDTRVNSPEDCLQLSLYFEAKTFLHGLLLVEDKLSMAHGLETRLPFLDNDLVDYAMKIPVRFKMAGIRNQIRLDENAVGNKVENYFQNTNDGKLVLRKAISSFMPEDVANRRKQGFSAPDASWFKGQSLEFVKKMILSKNSPIYNYLDFENVKTLVEEHTEGKVNRRLFIWSLLSFDQWCRIFLN